MYGAAPQDWQRFADQGLTPDLLPVVSDPNVPISARSKLQSSNRGKVPSFVLGDGTMAGMPGWSRDRTSPADVDKWATDSRLGICVQTRYVRAIDVDIDDPVISADVRSTIELTLGHLPCRSRGNSGKLLLAFAMGGTYLKRVIQTPHGRIEFLANGQQFVAVGTHPSGARYEWDDYTIPTLTAAEFDAVWAALAAQFKQRVPDRQAPTEHTDEVLGLSADEIRTALAALSPNLPHDEWLKAGMAVHHETRGEGLELWREWSAKGDDYPGDEELEYRWGTFGRPRPGAPVTAKTLVDMAAKQGVNVGPRAPASPDEFPTAEQIDAAEQAAPLKYEFKPLGVLRQGRKLSWIVKGVLPKAQLAALYGASGSGKTFFALDLAMSIARGLDWRGHRVKQTNVAYVVAEGADGFLLRAGAYAQHHGIEDIDAVPMRAITSAPNLRDTKDVRELIRGIKAFGGVGLVVVDTLAQTTPGANENASEDMSPAIANCQAIHAATGAMVLLVHHSGKDAARGMRGWSGMRGALDAEIEVARGLTGRVATLTKAKDGADGAEWGFELEVVQMGVDEDLDPVTSCVVVEREVNKAKTVGRKLGAVEALVNAVIQEFAEAQTTGIELDAVVAEAARRMPEVKGKTDTRRQVAKRAAKSLCLPDVGLYELAEDNTISVL